MLPKVTIHLTTYQYLKENVVGGDVEIWSVHEESLRDQREKVQLAHRILLSPEHGQRSS